jgi:large subunit ribosomal protein L9
MAKKQEVLLVADVLKLGNMGDIIKVAPGYARNYLYPHQVAIPASLAAKRQVDVLRVQAEKNEAQREVAANAQKKSIEGMTVQIPARVASGIDLFGAIGTSEIVKALAKANIVVDSKQVHLIDRIRRLGVYPIEVRLHKAVTTTVKVEVVNSDPNAPSLADALAAYEAERKAKAEAAKAAKANGDAAPAEGAEEAKAEEKKDEKPAKAKASKADGKGDSAGKSGKKK